MSGGIKSFEDLDAWRMAKALSVEIYLQTREGLVSKDFGFIDQLRNAALSIMNNISEGFGRRSDRALGLSWVTQGARLLKSNQLSYLVQKSATLGRGKLRSGGTKSAYFRHESLD